MKEIMVGALKDEAAGVAKETAGKVTGNDELREKGEEQGRKGEEQDTANQAESTGSGFGTDEPETTTGGQPGDSSSA